MNWFQHDSNSLQDAKIKKLLIRCGALGYAVYFHCLELIASDISESNLTFELEHDSEIIADNLRIRGTGDKSGREIVEDIMKVIIDLGLFRESEGRIFCFKLLKRINLSVTSSPVFRKAITEAKEHYHDEIMTRHDEIMTRTQSVMNTNQPTIPTNDNVGLGKPTSTKKDYSESFLTFYDSYPRKEGKSDAMKAFKTIVKSESTMADVMRALDVYRAKIERDVTETRFIKQPARFLRCYTDYLDEPKTATPKKRVEEKCECCGAEGWMLDDFCRKCGHQRGTPITDAQIAKGKAANG